MRLPLAAKHTVVQAVLEKVTLSNVITNMKGKYDR